MSKYTRVYNNSFSEYLAYRLNFILWRIRGIGMVLISYFLWLSVYANHTQVFGYGKANMLTYILLITFLQGIVLSTQTHKIASEINTGDLSNYLIRPINYFWFNFFRDLSDKTINTFFSLIEISLFIVFLSPPIFFQKNIVYLFLFLLSVI